MKLTLSAVVALAFSFALSACDRGPSAGLVLPDGDAGRGRDLFVNFHCNGCHTVRGVELPEAETDREYRVALGGQRSKAYADLVTSVINPSHRVSRRYRDAAESSQDGPESPMAVYNDIMTVTELVDIVAFLQEQYKVERVPRYRYVPYSYSGE